jgi:hypothetical protein
MTGIIPYKQLIKLHNNYQGTQDHLTLHIGKGETQSIWFKMDAELINFLRELLKPEREVSGLRVYLGEYKAGETPPGTSDEYYAKKLTVGFIATKEDPVASNIHIDHPDEVKDKTNLAFAAYNHGKICPPDICP